MAQKIQRKAPNWQYSLVTLGALFITAFCGFAWGTNEGTPFLWLFENVQMPMSATMFYFAGVLYSQCCIQSFPGKKPSGYSSAACSIYRDDGSGSL